MPYAHPRSYRLTRKKDFDRIFEQADGRVAVRGLLCIWRQNALGHPRIGLTASKKTLRTAIRRNRIRRILRERFRLAQHELPALDFVFIVRRDFPVAEPEQWPGLSEKLFQRIIRRLSSAAASQ